MKKHISTSTPSISTIGDDILAHLRGGAGRGTARNPGPRRGGGRGDPRKGDSSTSN